MLGHMVALGIGIALGLILIQFAVCVWNEINLDMRRDHRFLAESYFEAGDRDEALYHIGKAQNLQRWFIKRSNIGRSK